MGNLKNIRYDEIASKNKKNVNKIMNATTIKKR